MNLSRDQWRRPFDVHDLEAHVDPRGSLFEILRFRDEAIPGEGQLYTFSIEPHQRRGDHYHHEKSEWFTCVYGEAVLLLSSGGDDNIAIRLSPQAPKIVYVGPGVAHAVVNDTDDIAVFVSYGSTQHDPDNADTYRRTAYPEYR